MDQLDLKFNTEPVCPHCGRQVSDAWELDFGGMEGSTVVTCCACDEEFLVEREVTVTYSTSKLKQVPQNQEASDGR